MITIVSLAMTLFTIGALGVVLNRRNLIILLMSVELMLLAVNLLLIEYSLVLDSIHGQVFGLIILTIAAAESAIGLAILVAFHRLRGNIGIMFNQLLKG